MPCRVAGASRGGVARIGEDLVAGGFLAGVEGAEVGARHINLAAYLQHVWPPLAVEGAGNIGDGRQIVGDILADAAVAAGGALHETTTLVAQRGRQTVDLGFGDEGQFGVIGER